MGRRRESGSVGARMAPAAVEEEVRFKWLEAILEQYAVVVSPKSVAPELIKKSSQSERTSALVFAILRHLLTLVSILKALLMGSLYCNMGTPSK